MRWPVRGLCGPNLRQVDTSARLHLPVVWEAREVGRGVEATKKCSMKIVFLGRRAQVDACRAAVAGGVRVSGRQRLIVGRWWLIVTAFHFLRVSCFHVELDLGGGFDDLRLAIVAVLFAQPPPLRSLGRDDGEGRWHRGQELLVGSESGPGGSAVTSLMSRRVRGGQRVGRSLIADRRPGLALSHLVGGRGCDSRTSAAKWARRRGPRSSNGRGRHLEKCCSRNLRLARLGGRCGARIWMISSIEGGGMAISCLPSTVGAFLACGARKFGPPAN